MNAPVVLDPKEVAAQLRVPERSVLGLLRSGRLMGIRVARRWRITEAAVMDFLATPTVPRPADLPPPSLPTVDELLAKGVRR